MIDHTGIGVVDVFRSTAFYDAALGALGLRRVMQLPVNTGADGVGYGVDFPVFWIDRFHPPSQRYHTAFVAKSRAEVDAFYAAALKAGGTDNGPPGLREMPPVSPQGYYAAFVLDPDGNNIESVFRSGSLAGNRSVSNPARDITAGDVSVQHIPGFIGNLRDSLDALVAAGVERSALEQRLQKLENAHAREDKGLIHESLLELKGFVTNSATKLVSTGVVSLIDQILGFPSP